MRSLAPRARLDIPSDAPSAAALFMKLRRFTEPLSWNMDITFRIRNAILPLFKTARTMHGYGLRGCLVRGSGQDIAHLAREFFGHEGFGKEHHPRLHHP